MVPRLGVRARLPGILRSLTFPQWPTTCVEAPVTRIDCGHVLASVAQYDHLQSAGTRQRAFHSHLSSAASNYKPDINEDKKTEEVNNDRGIEQACSHSMWDMTAIRWTVTWLQSTSRGALGACNDPFRCMQHQSWIIIASLQRWLCCCNNASITAITTMTFTENIQMSLVIY